MCNCCTIKRRADSGRCVGESLPSVAQFDSGKKQTTVVMYDNFIEEFFILTEEERFFGKKISAMWPIKYCPNCGNKLNPLDVQQ